MVVDIAFSIGGSGLGVQRNVLLDHGEGYRRGDVPLPPQSTEADTASLKKIGVA